jgi:hypothetical protein
LQNLDWFAVFYLVWARGRFDEGIAIAKQAVEYDPLSSYAQVMLAFAFGHSGRGREAIQAASSARQLEESFLKCWASQHALRLNRQFE